MLTHADHMLPHMLAHMLAHMQVMPLFHLHGLMINVLVTAVAGATVLCAPHFDAPLFFQWLRPVLHHFTLLYGVLYGAVR